jgi:adhesin/invasin
MDTGTNTLRQGLFYFRVFLRLLVILLVLPANAELPTLQQPAMSQNEQATRESHEALAAQHLSALGGQFGSLESQSGDKLLSGYAQGVATGPAGHPAEHSLQLLGGSSRVSLGSSFGASESEIAADVLIPFIDDKQKHLMFSQWGIRRIDGRQTLNLGLGSRYFGDQWMTGGNLFFDNDLTGKNRRWGAGVEWWRDNLRLSANGYFRISSWHPSRDLVEYDERPANGWDLEASGWLPVYPSLGAKVKYEKYYGNNVALFGRETLHSNPEAMSLGASWTPVPLLTFELGHRFGAQGNNSTIGMMMNYDFGRSLEAHFEPSEVAAMRSLQGGRYDLVSRNNRIVLDHRKKNLLSISLPSSIEGNSHEGVSIVAQTQARLGLARVEWNASTLTSAGGSLTSNVSTAKLVLPPFGATEENRYVISAVAHDNQGNASAPAYTTVIVNGRALSLEKSSFSIIPATLVANGNSTAEATVTLRGEDDKALSGESVTLQLQEIVQALTSSSEIVHLGEFTEHQQSGIYKAIITAGMTPGQVRIQSNLDDKSLFSVDVMLKDNVVPAKIESLTAPDGASRPVGQSLNVEALVKDSQGNPVSNIKVTFSGPGLNITDETPTNEKGVATAKVSSLVAGDATLMAKMENGNQQTLEVHFIAPVEEKIISLTAPDGASRPVGQSLNVEALVKDSQDNPVSDIKVTFSGPGLNITAQTPTNEKGFATARISSLVAGDATLTARMENGSEKTLEVHFIAPVEAKVISVTAPHGDSSLVGQFLNVEALVKDSQDKPVSNIKVTFSGPGVNITDETPTNEKGIATARVSSHAPGNVILTAETENGIRGALLVHFFISPLEAQITSLTAPDGDSRLVGQSLNVEALVNDLQGNPFNNIEVIFSGLNLDITENTFTNEKGLATARVTSLVPGDVTLMAKTANGSTKALPVHFTLPVSVTAFEAQSTGSDDVFTDNDSITVVTVTNSQGQMAAGVPVELEFDRKVLNVRTDPVKGMTTKDGKLIVYAKSQGEGTFEIKAKTKGTVGKSKKVSFEQWAEVAKIFTESPLDQYADEDGRDAEFIIEVKDKAGKPVANRLVELDLDGRLPLSTTPSDRRTGSDGRLRVYVKSPRKPDMIDSYPLKANTRNTPQKSIYVHVVKSVRPEFQLLPSLSPSADRPEEYVQGKRVQNYSLRRSPIGAQLSLTEYLWYQADAFDESKTSKIAGANGEWYTLKKEDIGKRVFSCAMITDEYGLKSDWKCTEKSPVVQGLNGKANIKLTYDYTLNAGGPFAKDDYRWKARFTNASGKPVANAKMCFRTSGRFGGVDQNDGYVGTTDLNGEETGGATLMRGTWTLSAALCPDGYDSVDWGSVTDRVKME